VSYARGAEPLRKHALTPVALVAVLVTCVAVAGVLGQPMWAAALGAGLCLAYWALEVLAWRRGEATATFGAAIGVALTGMALRVALVVGVLAVLGFTTSPSAVGTAAIAFLAAFSLYLPLRFVTYTALQARRPTGAR
jgi:hypothetical protein